MLEAAGKLPGEQSEKFGCRLFLYCFPVGRSFQHLKAAVKMLVWTVEPTKITDKISLIFQLFLLGINKIKKREIEMFNEVW